MSIGSRNLGSTNFSADGTSASSILPPMRYDHVPTVDARYWTTISIASIFGCNLGDCLSFYGLASPGVRS